MFQVGLGYLILQEAVIVIGTSEIEAFSMYVISKIDFCCNLGVYIIVVANTKTPTENIK